MRSAMPDIFEGDDLPVSDIDVLDEILADGRLDEDERAAFQSMLESLTEGRHLCLSHKQRAWVLAVKSRFELGAEPSENLFSAMSEQKKAEERERAAKVLLPWENPDGTRQPMPRPPRRVLNEKG